MTIPEWLFAHEPAVRLAAFAGVLALMAAWEWRAARRTPAGPRGRRWARNLGLIALDSALVRLVFPLTAVGVGAYTEAHGIGLLAWTGWPAAVAVPLAMIALDAAIYAQHRAMHAVPALWRLHRVHHSDLDVDSSTGVRFHPLEILLSMAFKLVVIIALGAPALAVLLFELLLNAGSLFSHGNVRLPRQLDAALRRLIVTPDVHRIHHSPRDDEANRNFGFNLIVWDRLFGTYRAQPQAGHAVMPLGVSGFRDPARLHFLDLLAQPLRPPAAGSTAP